MSEQQSKRLGPVDAFSDMFKKHLKASDHNLIINNLILLRNVLKQGIKDSHLSAADEVGIRGIEETWDAVNVGCGCTRNKRLDTATTTTTNFISSDAGTALLGKLKAAYSLKSLVVDISTPALKCEV